MEIESGIPIPKRCSPRTAVSKAATRMKIGESILCETETELGNVIRIIKRLGGHYCQRKMDGGWRVWRIEKEKT